MKMLRLILRVNGSKRYKINRLTLLCTERGEALVTRKVVEDTAVKLLQLAATELPQDVKEAIRRAFGEEESDVGKAQLKAMLSNVELAEKTRAPLCQDTGVIIFYVKSGSEVTELDKVEEALREATVRATIEVPLRPNAVNPFTQKNTGDNTGRYIPYIHWEVVSGDTLEITVMPKGGGSENVSALGMLSPSEGVKGLEKFVVDTVVKAGAKPCPPTILGVAVGGGADIAMKLAKATLLKPLNQPNPNHELAKLEKELCKAVNQTGIGPMGLGGKTTALGVKVDYAHRHPASYPVAVAVQCWAARKASVRIHPDGKVEYLTHLVTRKR
jgi:fumarate hydratase subunit alpha